MDKIAVIDKEHCWTYKQIYNYVKTIDLTDIILGSEKNIGILIQNSLEYVLAYFTALKLGYTLVPINPKSKIYEIEKELEFCEISTIFVSKETIKTALKLNKQTKIIIVNPNSDKQTSDEERDRIYWLNDYMKLNGEEVSKIDHVSPVDVAIMLQTSGTTSKPKKVMLTHKNIISNIISHSESVGLSKDDKVLISLPMFFGYCNTSQFLTHLYLGGTLYILGNFFQPHQVLKVIEEEKITSYTVVPSMLVMLFNKKSEILKYRLSSLKYIFFGGGIMQIKELRILMDKLPHVQFIQTYGQTEASPRVTALLGDGYKKKVGSVGKPIPNVEVKIVDEKGRQLKTGQVGEIIVRGDNVMKGYYKSKETTSQVIIDGYLYTGDLGYMDADGYLYLKGRKKSLIICGGINIYPEELEEKLLNHPNIINVIITGKKHYIYGEIPVAFIEKTGHLTKKDVIRYCERYFSSYKIPKEVTFVESLDLTYNGKNKRHSLVSE